MKRFSKIENLTSIGLLQSRFDGQRFVRSYYLLAKSNLILFLALTTLFKYVLTLFFEQKDVIQLYIGCYWNYLDYQPKFYMGLAGLCLISWMTSLHRMLNRFNSESNESFMLWMRLSNEIPSDRRLIGISENENKSFWAAEQQFNFHYNRALYLVLVASYVTINIQIFLVSYDVDALTYVLVQFVHSVHHYFFIRAYFQLLYTPNVFHLGMLRFFAKKFAYIRRQVASLRAPEYDEKLAELVGEFNLVYLELLKINSYFKHLSGINLIHFAFLTVIVTFVSLFSDLRLRILFYTVIYSMYILIFGLAFKLANEVLIEMHNTNRLLQNSSFQASIETRRKVHLIDSLLNSRNAKVLCGFTCLDLFQMNSFHSFSIFIQCIIYLMMLIKLSNGQSIAYYLPALFV